MLNDTIETDLTFCLAQ